jgi:predicted Abi (CAAX) family protease
MGHAPAGGLIRAFRLPNPRAWIEALILLGALALLAGMVGFGSGLFEWSPRFDRTLMITALVAFIVPSLGEEFIFRGLLQPKPAASLPSPLMGEVVERSETGRREDASHPTLPDLAVRRPSPSRGGKYWLRIVFSLGLFVLWHPVQVCLGLPMAQAAFLDWRFLIIAAALGLACTISWQRSGSIWPAVFIHWAVVVGWKGLLV